MSDIDMNNLMEQFNKMLQNNEFPDELKSALNNFKNSSNNVDSNNKSGGSTDSTIPDLDIKTWLSCPHQRHRSSVHEHLLPPRLQ